MANDFPLLKFTFKQKTKIPKAPKLKSRFKLR